MNVYDYLDFENPANDSAAAVYRIFRKDARTPKLIEALQARGFSNHEIAIIFRWVSRIPSEWEEDKEPGHTKEKRRAEMAKRLKALLPHVENDPDLSRLYFGTSEISAGGSEPEPGQFSLAECIQTGIDELEVTARVAAKFPNPDAPRHRELSLKRYAIRTVSSLIESKSKRTPNKLTAEIVSVLLQAHVTPNDVSQARKDIRRKNFRDE